MREQVGQARLCFLPPPSSGHDVVEDFKIRIASIAETFCKVRAHTGRLLTIPFVLIKPDIASWSDQPIVRVQEIETVSRDGA